MKTIEIKDDDAYIILNGDKITVGIPQIPDGEEGNPVPEYVTTISILGLLISEADEEFYDLLGKKLQEYIIKKQGEKND